MKQRDTFSLQEKIRVLSHPLTWLVVILRLGAAFYIFIDPLWGFIASIFFDIFDYHIVVDVVGLPRPLYHRLDKYFDWITYVAMMIAAIPYGAMVLISLLLIWRTVGILLFVKIQRRSLFVLFPNIIDAVFVWEVLGRSTGFTMYLTPSERTLGFSLTVIFKILHELYQHYLYEKYFGRVMRTWYYGGLARIGIHLPYAKSHRHA